MASPPFNIDENYPGDSDLVSQFPAQERIFRDVVEDWISVDHNTSGQHAQVTLPFVSTPTGAASTTKVWANSVGTPLYRIGTGAATFFVAPGIVTDYAGDTAPEGWLFAFGQAISRSTFAALFDAIGTTFGVGDGETTFNLPDLRGRVVAGKDNMGGTSANRLTDADDGLNGDTLGDTGGGETQVLVQGNFPALNFTHTLTLPNHIHPFAGDAMGTHGHADSFTLPNHTHPPGTLFTESHGHGNTFSISGSQVGGLTRNLDADFQEGAVGTGGSNVEYCRNAAGGNAPVRWSTTTLSLTGGVSNSTALAIASGNTGNPNTNPAISGSVTAASAGTPAGTIGDPTTSPAINGTVQSGGTGVAFGVVQPTIILNKIIKF